MQLKGQIKILILTFIFLQLVLISCISDNNGKSQNMLNPSDYFENDALKLARAIDKGNLAEMKILLKSGLDVNLTGKHGMKFLFFALAQKQKPSLKLLLESGANPNIPMVSEDDTIHITAMAAGMQDSEFLKILLENGSDPNGKENDKPALMNVILSRNWENLNLLIDNGVNLNSQDKSGSTAMLTLASFNQFSAVSHLIDKGADFTIPDNTGATVAYWVQENKLDKESDYYKWQQIVKQQLINRGVKFPVIPEWLNNFGKVIVLQEGIKQRVKYMVDGDPDTFFTIWRDNFDIKKGIDGKIIQVVSVYFQEKLLYSFKSDSEVSSAPIEFTVENRRFFLFVWNSLHNVKSGVPSELIDASIVENQEMLNEKGWIPIIVTN
jgi:hypothetical protein